MNPSEPKHERKSRPLWPWVLTAIVLCLFTAGFSFCWPIYKANELVNSARAQHGYVYIIHQHPSWMTPFIAEETFLPGYDEINLYYLSDVPITDDRFRTLCENANLQSLDLDVSNCSPESLAELEHQTNLLRFVLRGCRQEEFPLDWLKTLRYGASASLEGLTVTPDQWPALLTSRICRLATREGKTLVNISHAERSLDLGRKHLTQTEAEAILKISDLKRLDLAFSTTTPEFWQTLSRHQALESLQIRSGSLAEPDMISDAELDELAKIPSLSKLTIIDDVNKIKLETETCERFVEMRPDVSFIFYTAGKPPSLIPHVFGRQQETTTNDE